MRRNRKVCVVFTVGLGFRTKVVEFLSNLDYPETSGNNLIPKNESSIVVDHES